MTLKATLILAITSAAPAAGYFHPMGDPRIRPGFSQKNQCIESRDCWNPDLRECEPVPEVYQSVTLDYLGTLQNKIPELNSVSFSSHPALLAGFLGHRPLRSMFRYGLAGGNMPEQRGSWDFRKNP